MHQDFHDYDDWLRDERTAKDWTDRYDRLIEPGDKLLYIKSNMLCEDHVIGFTENYIILETLSKIEYKEGNRVWRKPHIIISEKHDGLKILENE